MVVRPQTTSVPPRGQRVPLRNVRADGTRAQKHKTKTVRRGSTVQATLGSPAPTKIPYCTLAPISLAAIQPPSWPENIIAAYTDIAFGIASHLQEPNELSGFLAAMLRYPGRPVYVVRTKDQNGDKMHYQVIANALGYYLALLQPELSSIPCLVIPRTAMQQFCQPEIIALQELMTCLLYPPVAHDVILRGASAWKARDYRTIGLKKPTHEILKRHFAHLRLGFHRARRSQSKPHTTAVSRRA